MVWAIEHPAAGIVAPDSVDFRRVLEVASPYLGRVVGQYTEWNPLYVHWHDIVRDCPTPLRRLSLGL
jgi:homospermidine synthase